MLLVQVYLRLVDWILTSNRVSYQRGVLSWASYPRIPLRFEPIALSRFELDAFFVYWEQYSLSLAHLPSGMLSWINPWELNRWFGIQETRLCGYRLVQWHQRPRCWVWLSHPYSIEAEAWIFFVPRHCERHHSRRWATNLIGSIASHHIFFAHE